MATRAIQKAPFSRVWLSQKETWPVLAVMAGAGAFCAVIGGLNLASHPDVQWNREDRATTLRFNQRDGKSWRAHRDQFMVSRDEIEKTSIIGFAAMNKAME